MAIWTLLTHSYKITENRRVLQFVSLNTSLNKVHFFIMKIDKIFLLEGKTHAGSLETKAEI